MKARSLVARLDRALVLLAREGGQVRYLNGFVDLRGILSLKSAAILHSCSRGNKPEDVNYGLAKTQWFDFECR